MAEHPFDTIDLTDANDNPFGCDTTEDGVPTGIIVTFIPQKWVGRKKDTCISFGEPRLIDVTDRILNHCSLNEIHELTSNSYEADSLVDGLAEDHNGPFEVENVEESICDFFGVCDIRSITEDMVASKRKSLSGSNREEAKTAKLRLILDVEFTPNGSSTGKLKSIMSQIAINVANRGSLTGGEPAEVENWSYKVEEI